MRNVMRILATVGCLLLTVYAVNNSHASAGPNGDKARLISKFAASTQVGIVDGRWHINGIPADAREKPGSGGQLIAFVPSLDLVVTRQTGGSGDWQFEEYLRRACAAVVQESRH